MTSHETICNTDWHAHPSHLLICHRGMPQYSATRNVHHEFAFTVNIKFPGATEIQNDHRRIRTGAHDKVVLQLALITMINEIDTGIHVLIADPSIEGNIDDPILWIATD